MVRCAMGVIAKTLSHGGMWVLLTPKRDSLGAGGTLGAPEHLKGMVHA